MRWIDAGPALGIAKGPGLAILEAHEGSAVVSGEVYATLSVPKRGAGTAVDVLSGSLFRTVPGLSRWQSTAAVCVAVTRLDRRSTPAAAATTRPGR